VENKHETAGFPAEIQTENRLARDKVIPNSLELLVEATASTQTAKPSVNGKRPIQGRLPLSRAEWDARDAIIGLIEPELRPSLRGMTWTSWRKINGPVCLDMAKAGATPDEVYVAWRELCEEKGEAVHSMRLVQKRIASGTPFEDPALYPQPVSQNVKPWRHSAAAKA
jgi:hypothetical protein